MVETLPQPNGHVPSLENDPGTDTPPEIEATLARLSAYRKVRGVMILSRASIASSSSSTRLSETANGSTGPGEPLRVSGILRRSGTVFDGEGGEKYARAVEDIVMSIGKAVANCEPEDEAKFMRIRTKRHELIITPNDRYLLVVLQDPES